MEEGKPFSIGSWVEVKNGYGIQPYFSPGDMLQVVGYKDFSFQEGCGVLFNLNGEIKGPYFTERFKQVLPPLPLKLDINDWL